LSPFQRPTSVFVEKSDKGIRHQLSAPQKCVFRLENVKRPCGRQVSGVTDNIENLLGKSLDRRSFHFDNMGEPLSRKDRIGKRRGFGGHQA
jgi:hypothetical protein